MRALLRRYSARALDLWQRARREHSSPREVGWSVGIGVFYGCTPFLGLHMWLALGTATLLRLNRLWAFVGSRVSTNVMFELLAFTEIELAHRVRFGGWLPLSPRHVLDHWRELVGEYAIDWVLGCIPVGAALGAILGFAAYALALRWRREAGAIVALEVSPRMPAGSLPPSSGSPPTEPRTPPT